MPSDLVSTEARFFGSSEPRHTWSEELVLFEQWACVSLRRILVSARGQSLHIPLQVHVHRVNKLRLIGWFGRCREEKNGVAIGLGRRLEVASKDRI